MAFCFERDGFSEMGGDVLKQPKLLAAESQAGRSAIRSSYLVAMWKSLNSVERSRPGRTWKRGVTPPTARPRRGSPGSYAEPTERTQQPANLAPQETAPEASPRCRGSRKAAAAASSWDAEAEAAPQGANPILH